MDKQRWNLIEELFQQAADLSPDQRKSFLKNACEEDDGLFEEVLALLDKLDDDANLTSLVKRAAHDVLEGEKLAAGTRLGPYAIVEEIGRGGMGAVYRAERADDVYDQTVAIKLVRDRTMVGSRMDPERLQRFQEERQILARLEHPHIARIIDGGTTDQGVPYFVMEYVDGVPIDNYCNQNKLSQQQRLRLFGDVASAVQFAHQKLVIHSDLKPANVLVTKDGEVRLLDFGIARLLDVPDQDEVESEDAESDTIRSRALTPAYSSPEQIKGEPISTTSDVYALAVLLHEMLTGQLPFESVKVSEQTEKAVSAGIKKVLVADQLEPDLSSIISKALQADPDARYSGAVQMADDIQRYLTDYPVTARDGSWLYRFRKFYRRNRISSALTLALLTAVTSFAVLTLNQSRLVAEERDTARVERDRAEGLSDFLIETLVSGAPNRAQGRDVTIREVLDTANEKLNRNEHSLVGQAETQATLRRVVGTLYDRFGLIEPAEENLLKALQFHRAEIHRDEQELFDVLIALAAVSGTKFDHEKNLAYSQEAVEIAQTIFGPDHRHTLGTMQNIASSYMGMGKLDLAERMSRELFQRQSQLRGPENRDTLVALLQLGLVNQGQGELGSAREKYQQCVGIAERALGERNIQFLNCLGYLGGVLEALDEYAAARPALERHIAIAGQVLGENHPSTLRSMHHLASLRRGLGEYEASEALYLDTLSRRQQALGQRHVETLQSQYRLGQLYGLAGRHDEALALADEAFQTLSDDLGPGHPETVSALQVVNELKQSRAQ